MPSSTSSSDAPGTAVAVEPRDRMTPPAREIPDRPWMVLALVALVLTGLGVGVFESHARLLEYAPEYLDTADLFASARRSVEPDSLVSVGSSRIAFDLDLDVFEEITGRRPIQLARVGSSPRPMLHDLAGDESFRGTVIVGATPPLLFAPGGPPVQQAADYVEKFRRQSPSARSGQWLGMRLQEVFAFLNEDLKLRMMLERRVAWPKRPGFEPMPADPPYFGAMDAERRIRMTARMERDPEFQAEVQGVWQGILKALPPMPPEAIEEGRQMVLAALTADVEAIRGRGGRVIFVRFPSTEWFREIEGKMTPRGTYWDELLERTGAPGIHFEDHPELQGYTLPEWSHLTAAEAERFTRNLAPLVQPHLE